MILKFKRCIGTGRVKTKDIKKIAEKLVKENKNKFKKDFEANKKILDDIYAADGKRVRNKIAGYITRIMNR
ncbi:MAG: 30S ribosomal protein S17e [Candidatus Aenigmarchaeota archaeon]|nr:30S ribosomal protein S17e [Candidatus Aenigmarchaeota archaeon]